MKRIFFFEPYYYLHWDEETGEAVVYSYSSQKRGKPLSIWKDNNGYLRVTMKANTLNSLLVHTLIGKKVFGEREGYCINHIDGNKDNNRRENLEFVTISENVKHAVRIGKHMCNDPKRHGNYKDGRTYKETYKRDWAREYYKNNPEKQKERHRKFREDNREKLRQYSREYYKRNREKMLDNARRYRERKRNLST